MEWEALWDAGAGSVMAVVSLSPLSNWIRSLLRAKSMAGCQLGHAGSSWSLVGALRIFAAD